MAKTKPQAEYRPTTRVPNKLIEKQNREAYWCHSCYCSRLTSQALKLHYEQAHLGESRDDSSKRCTTYANSRHVAAHGQNAGAAAGGMMAGGTQGYTQHDVGGMVVGGTQGYTQHDAGGMVVGGTQVYYQDDAGGMVAGGTQVYYQDNAGEMVAGGTQMYYQDEVSGDEGQDINGDIYHDAVPTYNFYGELGMITAHSFESLTPFQLMANTTNTTNST